MNLRESMNPLTFFRVHVSMSIGGSSWYYSGTDLQYTHCVALILLRGFPVDTKASSTMGSWLALRQGPLVWVQVCRDHGVNLSPTGGRSRGLNLVFFFSPGGLAWDTDVTAFQKTALLGWRLYLHVEVATSVVPLYIGVSWFLLSLTAPPVIVLSEKLKPHIAFANYSCFPGTRTGLRQHALRIGLAVGLLPCGTAMRTRFLVIN